MRARTVLLLGFGVSLAVVGCKKDDTVTSVDFASDEDFLRYAVTLDSVNEYSEAERDALDDDGLQDFEYAEGFTKVSEPAYPITPLRWGRRILSVSRTVDVVIQGDSVATATITKTFAGNLLILAIRDSGGVQDTVLVTKPFTDAVTRKVQFVRVGRFRERLRNWRPVAITLVDGRSPTTDFQIMELNVITLRDTVTVTDPLNTWLRFGPFRGFIPWVRQFEPVQVRVVVHSQNDSSEFVMLHWGIGIGGMDPMGVRHRQRARIPMISQTDSAGVHIRVYQRTFIGHRHVGRFNAVVDAISYTTLLDDAAAYSDKFWGMPYALLP